MAPSRKQVGGFSAAFDRIRRASHHSVSPRLIGWSVLVGICSGVIVSLFRWILEWSLIGLKSLYAFAVHGHWWVIIAAVALSVGLCFAIAALVRSDPLISGSGIPDVEQRLRSSKPVDFPWFDVLWKKLVGGVLAIAPGMFLGREGPSIQISAAVAMGISHATATTRHFGRELVTAGAAAGLSAAFNAPIAGVLFVAEEIYARFSLGACLSAFAATLSANAVSLKVFGLAPVFSLPNVRTPSLHTYPQLVGLGVALGGVAWLYSKSLLAIPKWYDKIRMPRWARMLIPLLLVIPVGIWLPDALGGGNSLVTHTGQGEYMVTMLALLLAVRFVVSQISYCSGAPGGIFLPILTLGALCGALWSEAGASFGLWPGGDNELPLMVIVGMAGLFGAVSKAPVTAIILVMEMTSYGVLMPLGIVTLISYLVYDALGGEAIYDALGSATLLVHAPGSKVNNVAL